MADGPSSPSSCHTLLYEEALIEKVRGRIDTSGGPDACHPWTGPIGNKPTGKRVITIPLISLRKKCFNPRRIVYELALGTRLPTTQRVYDECDNFLCCNPRHLFGGTPEQRVEALRDTSGGPDACWPYKGMRLKGYGRMRSGGRNPWIFAHRVAYEMAYGKIEGHRPHTPDELVVMHTCDNPPCCNPKHLRLGTDADNIADCIAKGRNSHGPKHQEAMRKARARYTERVQRTACGTCSPLLMKSEEPK